MPSTATVDTSASTINPAAAVMPPPISNPTMSPAMSTTSPAVFKPKDVSNSEKDLDEGLDGLASQWGNLSLKPDVEGGSFVFQPNLAGSGCGLETPSEFFLLGTVRAVEEFNPRTEESSRRRSQYDEPKSGSEEGLDGSLVDKIGGPVLLIGLLIDEKHYNLGSLQLAMAQSCTWCVCSDWFWYNDGFDIMASELESLSTSERRRGDENSSHDDDSTELN